MSVRFDRRTSRVAVDLDGVLADFDAYARTVFDAPMPSGGGSALMAARWSALAKRPRFYRDLELMPGALDLWEHIRTVAEQVYILTAIPRRASLPHAERDKRAWVARHLGEGVEVRIGPYSHDKWRHARPGDVLIDDRESNVRDWGRRGGLGIVHVTNEETVAALWALAGPPCDTQIMAPPEKT